MGVSGSRVRHSPSPDLAICPHCGAIFVPSPGGACPRCGYPLTAVLDRRALPRTPPLPDIHPPLRRAG
ncbi:MAG: hypothetical protein QN173_07925 [Armatimonadota bacterium]|nr:hypothetical protein [Armatimonadota bacterium]MDR7402127.1 hypothetical protein [Armatimonadota bacterium]MDR7404104.1 hypothetical protein [Armatimonadota bacterium]MDR7437695.1 hypothetical protein [Armatimonadota bacterium]MDR7472392.1 hypothetical protein [Armatimonadota bacterium]